MFQRLRHAVYGLNPERSLGRIEDFDVARGYDAFAAACREASGAALAADSAPASDTTRRDGVGLIDVMPAARADALLAEIRKLQPRPPRLDDIDYSDSFNLPPGLEREVVYACLDGPAARVIEQHFGSHFHLYTYLVSRLQPGSTAKRSMLWHCDSGPSRHLKLLVYLEASDVSGANTAFLDRAASDRFLREGYTFGPVRHRREDLRRLARHFDLPFQPRTWSIAAGQGLLFEPARVLHRGVIPTRAPRHMITLVLLPGKAPWQVTYDTHGPVTGAFGTTFPQQARDLLAFV